MIPAAWLASTAGGEIGVTNRESARSRGRKARTQLGACVYFEKEREGRGEGGGAPVGLEAANGGRRHGPR